MGMAKIESLADLNRARENAPGFLHVGFGSRVDLQDGVACLDLFSDLADLTEAHRMINGVGHKPPSPPETHGQGSDQARINLQNPPRLFGRKGLDKRSFVVVRDFFQL